MGRFSFMPIHRKIQAPERKINPVNTIYPIKGSVENCTPIASHRAYIYTHRGARYRMIADPLNQVMSYSGYRFPSEIDRYKYFPR